MLSVMQDTKLAILANDPQTGEHSAPVPALPRLSLTVNGAAREATASTLLELLTDLGYGGNKVATAVNGDFVPERLRGAHRLTDGDVIEIVAPRQGG
jgi:sulfur carrier protein